MKGKLAGLVVGVGAGFVLSWARLSDPGVIRDMLLLNSPHVFLVMGTAMAVAAAGVRVLRAAGARAFITREAIGWSVDRPRVRHMGGAALFGIGWAAAGTCPGPLAAMVGEGRLGGLAVAVGVFAGVTLQRLWTRQRVTDGHVRAAVQSAV